MLNLELLQKVRDKVMFEPEQHDQAFWMVVGPHRASDELVSCPTAACVAGWACLLEGDLGVITYDGQTSLEVVMDKHGVEHAIEDRGQELLGLSGGDAVDLFDGDNERDYVLDRLDELIVMAKEERNQL